MYNILRVKKNCTGKQSKTKNKVTNKKVIYAPKLFLYHSYYFYISSLKKRVRGKLRQNQDYNIT